MNIPNDALAQTPVEALQLSLKTLGYLKRSQIYTLADLVNYTQEDLLILDRECGEEVIAALHQRFGLTLPAEDSL